MTERLTPDQQSKTGTGAASRTTPAKSGERTAPASLTAAERREAMKCHCGAIKGSVPSIPGYYKCRRGHLYLIASRWPR
jgi:hypothetical protein